MQQGLFLEGIPQLKDRIPNPFICYVPLSDVGKDLVL